jgi:hypothetical protein
VLVYYESGLKGMGESLRGSTELAFCSMLDVKAGQAKKSEKKEPRAITRKMKAAETESLVIVAGRWTQKEPDEPRLGSQLWETMSPADLLWLSQTIQPSVVLR